MGKSFWDNYEFRIGTYLTPENLKRKDDFGLLFRKAIDDRLSEVNKENKKRNMIQIKESQ